MRTYSLNTMNEFILEKADTAVKSVEINFNHASEQLLFRQKVEPENKLKPSRTRTKLKPKE